MTVALINLAKDRRQPRGIAQRPELAGVFFARFNRYAP
jgi:hypothetical protein